MTKEVKLTNDEFSEFTKDFLSDQPWITKNDGGLNGDGKLRCIRVLNKDTRMSIIVNNEGYDYALYVAIEQIRLIKK